MDRLQQELAKFEHRAEGGHASVKLLTARVWSDDLCFVGTSCVTQAVSTVSRCSLIILKIGVFGCRIPVHALFCAADQHTPSAWRSSIWKHFALPDIRVLGHKHIIVNHGGSNA